MNKAKFMEYLKTPMRIGWEQHKIPDAYKVAEYLVTTSVDKFKFKKTKYAKPHEYIILDEKNTHFFISLELLIQTKGYDKEFRIFKTRKMYRYYNIGKYRYWIMQDVCNRALIEGLNG
tara:strand:+ start:626 stop:979 length:354 start_codon:yes stop_codon:yes gene_type:complete